ncbi:hypothetical protein RHOSPDRAFT_26422 [Rhodotorula sp. JG-1b]|nr:hypothetical protein RHOSPDRAFT_26422 [Rhodotorula sp. JG-1b]
MQEEEAYRTQYRWEFPGLMRPVRFIDGKWVLTRVPTSDDQQQQHYMVGPGLVGSFDPGPAPRAFSQRKYWSWARGEHNQSRQRFVWDSRTDTWCRWKLLDRDTSWIRNPNPNAVPQRYCAASGVLASPEAPGARADCAEFAKPSYSNRTTSRSGDSTMSYSLFQVFQLIIPAIDIWAI